MLAYEVLIKIWHIAGVLCVVQLAACGSPSPLPPVRSPADGPRSLMAAVNGNDVPAIEAALRTGVDPDLREELQAQWNSPPSANPVEVPLVIAVREGHENAAEALLKAGADPNLREGGLGWGETPLLTAVRLGNNQLVSLLLRFGADVRLRIGPFQAKERIIGRSDALTYAVIYNRVESAEMLLIAGAAPNTEHLARAISGGHADIAYLLLAAGVNPRLVSTRGRTAIQEASLLPAEKRQEMIALIEQFLRHPVY